MIWADRIASEIRSTRTPRDGKIFLIRDEKTLSHASPLSAALMWKKKGDVFTFETPSEKQMTIGVMISKYFTLERFKLD